MEIILSIISLIVSVLALFVAIFVGWWVPNDIRIMDKLSAAEPMLYFIISHYGGSAGHGINMKLQNRGNVTAYNLALYLPGIKEPLWRIAELSAGKDHLEQSPLADDDPLYTRPFNGLTARLVYHDRYGIQYVASLDLTQQKRDDSFYNVITADHEHQRPKVTHPVLRFRDKWRLRERV
jgi:hypothetical protein